MSTEMPEWVFNRIKNMPKSSDGTPIATHDFQPDQFPFLLQTYAEDNGELLWETTVHEPGVLRIPGFAPRKVVGTVVFLRSRIMVTTTSDGTTETWQL